MTEAQRGRAEPRAALLHRATVPSRRGCSTPSRDAGFDDVTASQGRIVARIGPSGTRVGDLAEQALVTKQTATATVDRLERAGYVRRVPDPADARARLVVIAERGEEAIQVARAVEAEVEAEWVRHLGAPGRSSAAVRARADQGDRRPVPVTSGRRPSRPTRPQMLAPDVESRDPAVARQHLWDSGASTACPPRESSGQSAAHARAATAKVVGDGRRAEQRPPDREREDQQRPPHRSRRGWCRQ